LSRLSLVVQRENYDRIVTLKMTLRTA